MNDAPWSAYTRSVSKLSSETWALLLQGAQYWSGPGSLDEGMRGVMGLPESTDLTDYFSTVAQQLRDGRPSVSVLDLTRVLFATEIGIASSVLGPLDWHNFYGTSRDYDGSMAAAFAALQHAQDELSDAGVPASGTDPFGKYVLR